MDKAFAKIGQGITDNQYEVHLLKVATVTTIAYTVIDIKIALVSDSQAMLLVSR